MSYDTERVAINTYFRAQWGSTTPLGLDGHKFKPSANSVGLTIQSGAVLQGSLGRVSNRIDHMGVLLATIYTDGGKGSKRWRDYAETITGFLHGVTLDEAGIPITASEDAFLRFSPPGITGQQHPYIQSSTAQIPFTITTVAAPFVRYEYR